MSEPVEFLVASVVATVAPLVIRVAKAVLASLRQRLSADGEGDDTKRYITIKTGRTEIRIARRNVDAVLTVLVEANTKPTAVGTVAPHSEVPDVRPQ